MEIAHFIGFILNVFFGVYFAIFSVFCLKNERIKKIYILFLLLALSFLLVSVFYFLWSFGFVEYSIVDFSLIASILLFFRVAILLVILSYVFHNNNILSFVFFYGLVVVSFFFSISISFVVMFDSFLILLLLSLILYSKKEFQRVGMLGIFYSILSLVLFILLYFRIGDVVYVTIALNILFFLFLFELVYVIKTNTAIIVRYGYFKRANSVFFDFLKYFVFIVVLINFVFIGTVAIHELGHYGSAKLFGCGYSRIVYDSGLPHTELLCKTESPLNHSMTLIFGIGLPILISLFFFFSGGQFIREIGVLVIGFDLMISFQDLLDLGFSDVFALFFSIVGFIAVVIAVGLLVSSRAEERRFLDFTEGHKNFKKKRGKK